MASNPDPDSEKDPFLDHLRQRFSGEEELPSPALWAALGPRLPAPNPWLTRYVGGGMGVGLVVGVLLGWLVGGLPGTGPNRPAAPAPLVTAAPTAARATAKRAITALPVPATAVPTPQPPPAVAVTTLTRRLPARPLATVERRGQSTKPGNALSASEQALAAAPSQASASLTLISAPPQTPVYALPNLWHSALTLDSAIRQETAVVGGAFSGAASPQGHLAQQLTPAAAAVDSTSETPSAKARLAALLAAQQPVLLALQHHLDSLRATTRTAGAALVRPDSVPTPADVPAAIAAVSDTVRPLAPPQRWSALLLTEATTRWGELPGYHAATTRELLISAQTQAVALEYRVPDAATGAPGRWRLRAGVGETRLRDQFRFAADTVHHVEHHDTTWALTSTIRIRRDTTFTLRQDSIGRSVPILNSQGQVIGYQTVYDHFIDTTYYVTSHHDTTWTMKENVTASYHTQTERRRQDLRPNYRFWTIPLALQFDVWQRRRWSAGVSVGAQLLVFRGGNRPIHDPATGTYTLRRIGMHDGPFRPVSVALNTGLDVRYRLTDRLSALVGGQVRGWAVGPLRTGALPRWTAAGQLGLAWELGK